MDYAADVFQVAGYFVLLFISWFLLRKNFSRLSALVLSVVTVFAFEIAWEIPANFCALYTMGLFMPVFVLKHVFLLYPFYLWLYYDYKYSSSRWLLLLFVAATVFELLLVGFHELPDFLNSVGCSWLNRYIWVSVFLVNVWSWRKK